MNPDLKLLQPYPFEKLKALKDTVTPPEHLEHIALSVGEPKHPSPDFVVECLKNSLDKLTSYPSTKGLPELRESIAHWLKNRFHLTTINPETEVLPVNGTREALFAFAQAVVDGSQKDSVVAIPNPFYQIYEGAAFLSGATPYFLNCTEQNAYHPDFDKIPESVWQQCQLIYLCSPGNPTGSVLKQEHYKKIIALSDKYNFIIASDECYSELYFDESNPPLGLLQACKELGRDDYKNCVVFHSLSKRSNLPGLRSGFVAGDAEVLADFLLYRTYHGCAMPIQHQLASIAAWDDENHVKQNRDWYREKFDTVLNILDKHLNVQKPEAGFYLWATTPTSSTIKNDVDFAQQLYAQQNITVLPGSFLSREADGINPGANKIRMALVAPLAECVEAAERIQTFMSDNF